MQTCFRVFHQQQRTRIAIQTDGSLGLQKSGKQPQQNHPMSASAGPVDHPVNDIEIAPASLLIMGSTAHQTMARLRGSLLGKIVLQQLHHGREPLADLPIGEILRTRNQLACQEIKLAGGDFHFRHMRARYRYGYAA
ncbi:hypothetical protein HR12_33000 [Microbacterium sp. SUBG005]|nr:hypothetical protein HR12_33000 [Microbacterium sp. SUBG005]